MRRVAPEHTALSGQVLLRDSKTPRAPYLTLTPESFAGWCSWRRARG